MRTELLIDKILKHPRVYRIHAAMVDGAKIAAIRKIRDDFRGLKVLDIGCGPGNNAHLFQDADYTGIDINERYIARARRLRPGCKFVAGDAGRFKWKDKFDFILVNSFFHHLPDRPVREILSRAGEALREEGAIVMEEPLIPAPRQRYHRFLMNLDRGDYFRSIVHWEALVRDAGLAISRRDFYQLRVFGLRGYNMVSLALTVSGI